jgi:hypothetical protein
LSSGISIFATCFSRPYHPAQLTDSRLGDIVGIHIENAKGENASAPKKGPGHRKEVSGATGALAMVG